MRLFVATGMLLLSFSVPTEARSFCVRSEGWDFRSAIRGFSDYVSCLHAEQVETINKNADLIDRVSEKVDTLSDLANSTNRLSHSINDLADANTREIERLAIEKLQLERRVKDLEARIQVLFDEREVRSTP